MADVETRRAAWIATLIAVPVTLAVAVGVLTVAGSDDGDDEGAGTAAVDEPVAVSVPSLSDDDAVICRALLAKMPDTLLDLAVRPVTGDAGAAELAAAFGDPAVTVVCGVPPVAVPDTDTVWPLAPTCWYAEERDRDTVWTTVDRSVPVRVTVPAEYEEPGQLAAALSPVVADAVPAAEADVPSGCAS